jgi:hypothetical protein
MAQVVVDRYVELRNVFSGRQPEPAASFSFTSSDTVQFRLRLTLGTAPYALTGSVRLVIYDEDYQVLVEIPFVPGSSWVDENPSLGWLGFDLAGDHPGFAALATAKDHFFSWRLLGAFGGDVELLAAQGISLYTKLIESATIPTQPDVTPIVRDYDNLTQAATQAGVSAFRIGDYVFIRGTPSSYAAQYGIWKVVRGTGTDPGLDYQVAINFADGGAVTVLPQDISYTNPSYPAIDNVQEALDQALSGSPTYVNPTPTTIAVGGISAGTTFPAPQTVQQMFDKLLYPYLPPTFSSFAITGITTLEVGASIPASVTFTWGTTNSTNVSTNSVTIGDQSQGLTLATGQPNDGTQAVTMPASVTKTTATTHVFEISATNTNAIVFTRTLSVSWLWRLYYGASSNPTLSSANILALAGQLSGYPGSYAMPAGGYKYICYAHAAGGQLNSVKDAATQFSIPMATSTDNAAYSNVDGGGYSYALVSHTNQFGVSTNYRVYRSKNILGGTMTVAVT